MAGENISSMSSWGVTDDFDVVMGQLIALEFEIEKALTTSERVKVESQLSEKRTALYAMADPKRLEKFSFRA